MCSINKISIANRDNTIARSSSDSSNHPIMTFPMCPRLLGNITFVTTILIFYIYRKITTIHFPSPNHVILTVSWFHSYLSFTVSASSSLLLPVILFVILFAIPPTTPLLSPLPHGQTQWPRLPASFDVSDVTPMLQMPLHRQSYPLWEPAQPTERTSH